MPNEYYDHDPMLDASPYDEDSPHDIHEAVPRPSWRLTMAEGLWYHVEAAPNWFHRAMQRLLLGFVWQQLDDQGNPK